MNGQDMKDPVVQEFDVVIVHDTNSFTGGQHTYKVADTSSAYIVQYPTRIQELSQQQVSDVMFQPLHEKLTTQVSTVDAHTDRESDFRNVNKTTFRSRKIPTRAQYAVGSMEDGRLLLRPVKAVLQMQPVFDYIDDTHVEEENARQETALLAKQEAQASQNRILGTAYKVRETNKSRNRKLKSFGYMQRMVTNDRPLSLGIEDFTGRFGEAYGGVLDGGSGGGGSADDGGGGTPAEVCLGADDYCQRLCGMVQGRNQSDTMEGAGGPVEKLNLLALKTLPLPKQVEEVLRCGHVVSHASLMHILRHAARDVPQTKIAGLALEAAYLIQGHWVVHRWVVCTICITSTRAGGAAASSQVA
jgi:hypothetical protein